MSTVGFTIIELMTAIAVMAVMLLVAIPNILGRMPQYRVDAYTSALYSELRSARSAAVSEARPAQVSLDTNLLTATVSIDRNANGSYETDECVTVPLGDSQDVMIAAGAPSGTFDSRGMFSCAAGYWSIKCAAKNADTRYIYVFQGGQVQKSDEEL